MSLRARLVVSLVTLLAAACAVVGTVTVTSLHGFLLDRLDDQLTDRSTATAGRFRPPPPPTDHDPNDTGAGGSALPLDPPPPDSASPEGTSQDSASQDSASQDGVPRDRPPGETDPSHRFDGPRVPPPFLLTPGQREGTLGAIVDDGVLVRAGVLTRDGESLPVPGVQQDVLRRLPVDTRPHTRDLGSLGAYRLVATRAPDGSVVITGLPLAEIEATTYRSAGVVTVVALYTLVLVGMLGWLMVRRALDPLRRMAATAARVTEMTLDRGEVALAVRVPGTDTDPRTEVGRMGAALNRLLEHVAAALNARHANETRVRRFVADASHELRTPLAAIRGYAELTRPRRDAVPPDVAQALDRVESATLRMSTLVDELLLLARLDAGRPLDRDPVDLTLLCLEGVEDARAAGPDHRWELALPAEPVVVPGDKLRLHHVVANLLANARCHTPPGTRVRLALDTCDDGYPSALITVTDDGPGIPADLQADVFARFVRGDFSRSRTAGSTGLGLAIVAAIVESHGGTVAVTSEPGATRFEVRLPGAVSSPDDAPPSTDDDPTDDLHDDPGDADPTDADPDDTSPDSDPGDEDPGDDDRGDDDRGDEDPGDEDRGDDGARDPDPGEGTASPRTTEGTGDPGTGNHPPVDDTGQGTRVAGTGRTTRCTREEPSTGT